MPYNGIKAREARQKLIEAMLEAKGKPFESASPLQGKYPTTSGYGMREHPILKKPMHHSGIDIGAPSGTPVYASADGYVSGAMRNDPVGGNQVYVQHPGGQQTRYLHLSKFADRAMKAGPVKKGELLGYVGSTGRSTGPHLHYGLYENGHSVDPRGTFTDRGTQYAAAPPIKPQELPRPTAPKPRPQPQPQPLQQVAQVQPQPAPQPVAYQAPRISEDEITRNLNLQQLALARLPRDLMPVSFA